MFCAGMALRDGCRCASMADRTSSERDPTEVVRGLGSIGRTCIAGGPYTWLRDCEAVSRRSYLG